MKSIWQQTAVPPRFSPGPLPAQAQTVIIGGGMAGILTSFLLKEAGVESIVLEARQIGGGQTCRTTAKITSQHGLCYDRLIRTLGTDSARLYARANEAAVAEYRRIIAKYGISCHFQELSSCLYTSRSAAALRREAEAAFRLGLPARLSGQTALPFPVKTALYFDRQAQFHPLEFLYTLAGMLRVYENTPVLEISGNTVRTAAGTVRADHVIFACHYPFLRSAGLYFARMHQERSYVLAIRDAFVPDCMYYGTDRDAPSLRSFEGLLLIGGSGHRTGETPPQDCYRALARNGKELGLLPAEAARSCQAVAARWSAQDCMTLDGLPYIGRFSRLHFHWYVATGFGKWGMTGSMAAACLLRDLLLGRENPYAALFSPQRFPLPAVLPSLQKESGHALRSLTARLSSAPPVPPPSAAQEPPRPPFSQIACLAPGEGRIVTYRGRKTGVSLDKDGVPHFVSPYCPHLGCQLTWNATEKTWDCPCHGSRFTCDGRLLDGPAQRGLSRPFQRPRSPHSRTSE